MNKVKAQNKNQGLNSIEEYLFVQRSAVIELDNGYLTIDNVGVDFINF